MQGRHLVFEGECFSLLLAFAYDTFIVYYFNLKWTLTFKTIYYLLPGPVGGVIVDPPSPIDVTIDVTSNS